MSKKICLLSLLLAATAVVSLHAEDKVLVQIGPSVSWKSLRGKVTWGEGNSFKCTLPAQVVFPARFKVNPSKIYTLSGEFRSVSGEPTKDNMWFGFLCYDEQGREITSRSVTRVSRGLGEVAVEAPKGSKSIVLKSLPAGWEKLLETSRYFAFDAKADRSDLPNFNLARYVAKSVTKRDDGTVEVKLANGLGAAVPAGTPVALNTEGDTYQFVSRAKPGTDWVSLSGSFALKAESGILAFRPTTAAVAIGFFCRDKSGEIEVRNIKLVESED